ncbi:FixJ family two-component response regulator [Sphingomonas trueperi]|uniref:response regulator transcription factor n=1 Tax=Sphingomonas trueperi TaxID=53317 RepID=UPI0033978C26
MIEASRNSLIAIVDDDSDVRGSLNSLLRSAGHESVSFACAEDLLSGDPERFGWIITDLHMPGMTGLELQAEINRLGVAASIVLMTAFPTPAFEEQALKAGACAFMTKPIDPDVLLDVVEQG